MSNPQPGIFAEGSTHHHHLEFKLRAGTDAASVRAAAAAARRDAAASGAHVILSFGPDAWRGIAPDRVPAELRPFAPIGPADGLHAPATQRDIWIWLHSGGRDTNFDGARAACRALSGVAALAQEETGFVYHDSRDMIGFVDGTANPKTDADRRAAALIPAGEVGAGGAYAMTQTWVHDLDKFHALPVAEQERAIGRTKADDIELEGDALAPGAHIVRTDAELDGVRLKIFRRSIPYGGAARHGLYFVAFARDPVRFEVQLQRMFGTSGDGLHDHLIMFSAAETGSFWLAPSEDDLNAVLG